MKKKYITLEEVLALRGTDTKIYVDGIEDWTLGWVGETLCRYKNDKLSLIDCSAFDDDKHYILEQEEFKVEHTGLYKTRDGRTAYVSIVNDTKAYGIVECELNSKSWCLSGRWVCDSVDDDYDLVEYIGE